MLVLKFKFKLNYQDLNKSLGFGKQTL